MHDHASLLVPQGVSTVVGGASYSSDGHPAKVEALNLIVGDSTQVKHGHAGGVCVDAVAHLLP